MIKTKELAEVECSPPIDFVTMLNALACPEAFSFALPNDAPVSIIQTHALAVLLTPDRVYKLKKPKNFGFFDYSTPASAATSASKRCASIPVLHHRSILASLPSCCSPIIGYVLGLSFRRGMYPFQVPYSMVATSWTTRSSWYACPMGRR